jgi:hypothetical protein
MNDRLMAAILDGKIPETVELLVPAELGLAPTSVDPTAPVIAGPARLWP